MQTSPSTWEGQEEDQKFQAIFSDTVTLRVAWDVGDPVSKTPNNEDDRMV